MRESVASAEISTQPRHTESRTIDSPYPGLIQLSAGTALLGTDNPIIPGDGEGPLRRVQLDAYALGSTSVSNAQFAEFVSATHYVTDAERVGHSMVFQEQVGKDADVIGSVHGTPWWHLTRGASWKNPGGAAVVKSVIPELPVVHVSWHDAKAYCDWAKGRLPSEAEWENAARANSGDVRYPWGNQDPQPGLPLPCNIWRGEFPAWEGESPQLVTVNSYRPNQYGFYNLCGNVWEWTACAFDNGFGPDASRRILKGGSYLCCNNYCFRYRIAARIGVSAQSTTSHQGFRIAFDGP